MFFLVSSPPFPRWHLRSVKPGKITHPVASINSSFTDFVGFLYLILPMNILWKILDDTSKNLIRDSNISQNNTREDYSGKELYGSGRKKGGIIWDNLNTKNISNDICVKLV